MENNSLEDFIEIYDGYFRDNLIDFYIEYFDTCAENKLTNLRGLNEPTIKRHQKDDSQIVIPEPVGPKVLPKRFKIREPVAVDFLKVFWDKCYSLYAKKYSLLDEVASHSIMDVVMQKTSPGQGYHMWHSEVTSMSSRNRILAFNLYLNDVEEGGETEFLYQRKRVSPKKGRLVIWPAYFTHAHRGNPPLSGDKYIITGWVEFSV